MYRLILFILSITIAHVVKAQGGNTAYEFLKVPISAHSAALGGNVSIIEDDATLMFDNPSLLSNVSDKTLNLDFTSYIASSIKLSAGFVKQVGDRGTVAVGAQVLRYGKMDETDTLGETIGEFSASDIGIQGSFAYLLSDDWTGAVTGKCIFGNYANYSSVALGVDLALNYYSESSGLSMSLVGKNLGGQVKALYDDHEKMPFDLALGISQELAAAPLRLSLTLDDLTTWEKLNFWQHLIVGAEVFPSNNTWVALGYNFRRNHEMKVLGSSHWAGLSLGAGLNIKRLKVGVAWGKYHVGGSSLIANISFSL